MLKERGDDDDGVLSFGRMEAMGGQYSRPSVFGRRH